MSIDLANENVVSLTDAPKAIRAPTRRKGKKPSVATWFRWAKDGLRRADGTRIVLETIRVGGTICTSVEAFQRFCDALTASPPTTGATIRTTASRRRAEERTDRALDLMGV